MNKSPGSIFPVLIAFLLATLACVIPGLPASQTIPTADSAQLATMIAGTFSAAMAQTAGAPMVTPDLPLPSGTPLPADAPGTAGTNIEELPDGTTKYTDNDGKFEVVYPFGWLAVRPNTDEFSAALTNEGANNPFLHDQMMLDQTNYDAEFDRLYSYALRPDIENNTLFGFSKVAWDSEDSFPLGSENLGNLVRELESSGIIPGFLVDVSQLYENSNGVSIGEIGGRYTISDGQGGAIPFYASFIFFKPTPDTLCRIKIYYARDFQLQLSTDVEFVIDSIKLSGQ